MIIKNFPNMIDNIYRSKNFNSKQIKENNKPWDG